jgi:hypothetical protein
MAQAKRASKRKRRRIALPALGAAGASLMMANGASSAPAPTATSLQDTLLRPVITLDEEEIADVSLGTFYVFDKENESQLGQGIRLAAARCGGCGRCGGRCAAARCAGAARCAVARCAGRCGCAARCGGCGGCGGGGWFIACAGCVSIGCGGGCWRWTAAGWVWVC